MVSRFTLGAPKAFAAKLIDAVGRKSETPRFGVTFCFLPYSVCGSGLLGCGGALPKLGARRGAVRPQKKGAGRGRGPAAG